jgi:putative YphP/YqiW family bacilliredoxin
MDPETIISKTREQIASIGCTQLTTPEAVDAWIDGQSGLSIVFFNSLCGCTSASARPGLSFALEAERPDSLVTVFAGVDREATQRMRERFLSFPPSSPSFLFVKDGHGVELYERERIIGRQPSDVGSAIAERIRFHRSSDNP